MQGNRSNRGVTNQSQDAFADMDPHLQGHQNEVYDGDINIQQIENSKGEGKINNNPYQREENRDNLDFAYEQGYPPQEQYNHQQPNQPQVIQNGNTLIVNNPPPNVIIINQTQPAKPDPVWTRQERIGCCCVSVHHQTYCCNFFCMDSLCRCVQSANLCCYCHNQDCMYCCIHQACRTCCFQKEMCECMLECCKHMPICLLIDCLKGCGCQGICGCLQNCNICDALNGCDCKCAGQILGCICEILCCFFK